VIAAGPSEASGEDVGAQGRPDAQLVAAVARGDAAAFRILLERHSAGIHRLAYRMVGQASEADDVTQETFVRLWTGAAGWRPDRGGGLSAWLRRVATNLCLDRLRRRKRLSDEPVPERVDGRPRPDAELMARSLAEIAAAAVASLPDRQRAAIVLTYYEDLPNAAAAEAMQINLKALESLLVRARTALKAAMIAADLHPSDFEGVR
jgi:RNA polymerase sigma-70 factor (ECF subfamily)